MNVLSIRSCKVEIKKVACKLENKMTTGDFGKVNFGGFASNG